MTKVLDSFRIKKSEDSTFFYKFELDDENKVKNIFWRDGSSLKYYVDFRDCVNFDTAYMTNRYRLPFAPFCRNHWPWIDMHLWMRFPT